MIVHSNGDWVQWDSQLGTYRGSVGGTIKGAPPTYGAISAFIAATGISLTTDEIEALAFDKGVGSTLPGGAMPPQMSKVDFVKRFTLTERAAARASTDVVVEDFMWMLDHASYVDVTDPLTIQAVEYLAAMTPSPILASQARVTAILANP